MLLYNFFERIDFMKKVKRKLKVKNLIMLIILLISIILVIISIIYFVIKFKNNNSANNTLDKINNIVKIEESTATSEIIEQKDIDKSDPYWDYIKEKLINVDFNELKKINSSVVGWIQVNGTNINYPFVQTDNNEYYLNHSIDKSYNTLGWVFLDYRNNVNSFDRNTIIYAHGLYNGSMFGSLRKIFNNGWFNNKDNFIIKLSTEYENTLWQIFSVYHIPTTNDYIRVNFKNDNNYLEFLNTLINRSAKNFNTTVNESDKILTLSSCFNSNEKVVIHAKLIKREKRN